MSKSKRKIIEEAAEGLGWRVEFGTQKNGNTGKTDRYVEFSQYSPAGQDFSCCVFYDTLGEIPHKVYGQWEDFDVEEHVKMWLDAKDHGVHGVVTLVHDAEAIEEMLKSLWLKLDYALRCINEAIEKAHQHAR